MTLQQFLETNGYETRSYSGRGMMGKECLAVGGLTMFELGYLIGSEEHEFDYDPGYASPKEDSLGQGTIIYFPNISWSEGK